MSYASDQVSGEAGKKEDTEIKLTLKQINRRFVRKNEWR